MEPNLLPSRRVFVAGTVAVGAATGLVACGGPDTSAEPSPTGTPTVATTTAKLGVGKESSVKVGGKNYLLFREAEDKVLAYSSVCTHKGCQVGVGSGDFSCPCHGSRFSRTDGSATHGPAKDPLQRFAAAVDGENIVIYL